MGANGHSDFRRSEGAFKKGALPGHGWTKMYRSAIDFRQGKVVEVVNIKQVSHHAIGGWSKIIHYSLWRSNEMVSQHLLSKIVERITGCKIAGMQ